MRPGLLCWLRLVVLLACGTCMGGRVSGQDVSWLAEVTQSPASPVLPQPGRIEPLLERDGKRIGSVREWQAARQQLRQRWLQFLGPVPQSPALDVKILSAERVGT
ncbi:MAG: hypothetical protein ACKPJJ_27810, partial [Planctomycetaceae bacterium]